MEINQTTYLDSETARGLTIFSTAFFGGILSKVRIGWRSWVIYAGVGIATCVFLYLAAQLIPVSHVATGPGAVRYRNAAWIGNALRRYQTEHGGRLPNHLSELVPNFVPVSNIDWFFWPPVYKSKAEVSNAVGDIRGKIDSEGAFTYLGSNGVAADLVLYERVDLWTTNNSETRLTILTTNFLPKFRTAAFVQQRLNSVRY